MRSCAIIHPLHLELETAKISEIKSNVEMAFNLACRALCHTQKLNELSGATAFKAFSNVGHNGDARTTYLISKSKVVGESSAFRNQIDILGQFSRFLPGGDVLKAFE